MTGPVVAMVSGGADSVCLLDVPVHKTGTAFTKPVDPLLGQAIEAWQALRPAQPATLDRKTSQHVDMLFAVRAQEAAPRGTTLLALGRRWDLVAFEHVAHRGAAERVAKLE